MREVILHHPIADITIRPIGSCKTKGLRQLIIEALNNYVAEGTLPASRLHEAAKARHGKYYRTIGYYLRLYRMRQNLTQKKLALRVNVQQHHISEMENNKRPIGKNLAKKLSKELKCDYHQFL